MDNYEYSQKINQLLKKINNIELILKPNSCEEELEKIKKLEEKENFWSDVNRATKIQQSKNKLLTKLKQFKIAKNSVNDANELFELAVAEKDEETINTLFGELENLQNNIIQAEIQTMLSKEDDDKNAIVSIHPGAGGTESCDWAEMLYRMYLRWADVKGFKIEILDHQNADEAGIKDVSFIVSGINAYGYLKIENGIHRLVRISPFDSNSKRHTSFASVMVSPEVDDNINIEIDEQDLRIDTYRASGAGGQHVNKTESAIRITHIPTNTIVQCQNDRSQHKNKSSAMKMLKSRLYEIESKRQQAEKDGIPKNEIGWGHQIRSYVMQPYQQVKDTRTNIEYSNVNSILDGNIDKIIEDVLIYQNTKVKEKF